MANWKQRLFDNYVSTGQAARKRSKQFPLRINDYPFYRKTIKDHLPGTKDISIVDLACGHGELVYVLKQLGYQHVIGIDISPEQVKLAHDLGIKEIECRDFNRFLGEKKESFDVIFLMNILEHLSKDELFILLDKVYASLRKNGTAIIQVPNAEGLFGMRVRYGDLTHEICFTQQSIRQALRACGFQDIKCIELKPVVHGVMSFVRHVLWRFFSLAVRLLLTVETGAANHIISQNMLVIARKKS
jgi:2-polyprenyl-3-methyl-5-hydroxy-6-metoxy-1,4-benzoquinol methylase